MSRENPLPLARSARAHIQMTPGAVAAAVEIAARLILAFSRLMDRVIATGPVAAVGAMGAAAASTAVAAAAANIAVGAVGVPNTIAAAGIEQADPGADDCFQIPDFGNQAKPQQENLMTSTFVKPQCIGQKILELSGPFVDDMTLTNLMNTG